MIPSARAMASGTGIGPRTIADVTLMERLHRLERSAGAPRVIECVLQRIELLTRLTEVPLERRDHLPRAGQAPLVPRRLVDADGVFDIGPHQVERSLQLALQPPAGKRGVGDELGVAEFLGQGAELRRERGRLFGEPALPERGRQVREERESSRIGRVEQRLGAAQQVGDRPHVLAGVRAGTRSGEPVRGLTGEPSRLVVERPELLSVPERLLEVVPDDLVLLLGALAADASDPRGEPFVQVGSAFLGDRPVGGVPDQDVAESERLFAGDHRAIRPHELLADQRTDQIGCVVAEDLGEQVANGAGVELLADHGGTLDDATLVVGQAFETRGEERRDRGWDRDRAEIARRDPGPVLPDQHPVVDHHREHLLDEQRVASGRLREPVGRLGCESRRRRAGSRSARPRPSRRGAGAGALRRSACRRPSPRGYRGTPAARCTRA